MTPTDFIYTDYELLLRNLLTELYVYTELMRIQQRRYFQLRLRADLELSKSSEIILDTKLKLMMDLIKKQDPQLAIYLEEKLRGMLDRSLAKQIDLFKL